MVLYVKGEGREVCCGIVCGGGGRSVVVLYVEGREVCCGIVCGGGGRFVVVLYVGGWR